MQDKIELRAKLLQHLKQLDPNYRIQAKDKLLNNILPLLKQIKSVAIYRALNFELSVDGVIEYLLSQNIKIYQPIAYRSTKEMQFAPFERDNSAIFYEDNYLLLDSIKWYNLDLILVPLVAVDLEGHRLGKGGGYYDQTLTNNLDTHNPILCGVGFTFQLVKQVPYQDWDLNLDYFVSEDSLIKF